MELPEDQTEDKDFRMQYLSQAPSQLARKMGNQVT
jgi:hypothetical protein